MELYKSGLTSRIFLNAHDLEIVEFFVPSDEIEDVRVLITGQDAYGINKYLLEYNGFRGWLEDGTPYNDIKWHEEFVDGWHESVALDGEDISEYAMENF